MIGATIGEAQERMSYREYLTRLAWLEQDKNQPSKTEWYLMRVCQRIMQFAGWGSKEPDKVTLDMQRVEWIQPTPQPELSQEEQRAIASAQIKAAFLSSFGGRSVKVTSEHRAPLKETT